jgi:hypothetical protein
MGKLARLQIPKRQSRQLSQQRSISSRGYQLNFEASSGLGQLPLQVFPSQDGCVMEMCRRLEHFFILSH